MKVLVDDFIKPTDVDATAGIQAAMDAVSDHKAVNMSPAVEFTAGKEYTISSTVLIKYGIRVIADGATILSQIYDDGPMFQWGDADHKPWQPSWKGGTVRGHGNTVFKIERANHGVIEDVRVGDADIGIALDGADPVQWEIRRCFVSNCRTACIRAHRANVLRIVGGKVHNKRHDQSYGLHITSSSSVSIDSLDISLCTPGAALFERCTGLDVRALYTERCGGEPLNDNAVVTLRTCTGFSFSGCRFVAPHGTVTGSSGLAWGLDIEDCDGGSVTGCMSHTTRKGFARVRGSQGISIDGCTEHYFDKRQPRILWDQSYAIGRELLRDWEDRAVLVRGVSFDDLGVTWEFKGGVPEAIMTIDTDVPYRAGDVLELSVHLTPLDFAEDNPGVAANDMPVLFVWMQNPDNLRDNNKQDRQALVPLTPGISVSFAQQWVPEHDGEKVRIYIGTRRRWRGFRSTTPRLSLYKMGSN